MAHAINGVSGGTWAPRLTVNVSGLDEVNAVFQDAAEQFARLQRKLERPRETCCGCCGARRWVAGRCYYCETERECDSRPAPGNPIALARRQTATAVVNGWTAHGAESVGFEWEPPHWMIIVTAPDGTRYGAPIDGTMQTRPTGAQLREAIDTFALPDGSLKEDRILALNRNLGGRS